MSEELKLPAHIEAVPGGQWFINRKKKEGQKGHWIHESYIAKYCETWWTYHPVGLKRTIVSNKKNLKAAKMRWDV